MVKTCAFLVLFLLTGLVQATTTEQVETLATNEAISNDLVESLANKDDASILLETPYKGFYELKSDVKNLKIVLDEIVAEHSFPDKRWENLAKEIASLVQMPAYSTGSRIDPKATGYVVFYDRHVEGLEPEGVIYLPTSAYSRPNTLVVLMIEHDNHLSTRDALGTRTRSAHQNTNRILYFELAL